MYIDLVDPLPKITHLRRVRKAIVIGQNTARCNDVVAVIIIVNVVFVDCH